MIRLFDRVGERFAVGLLKGVNWVIGVVTERLVKGKK
jgi:hypothetical protein